MPALLLTIESASDASRLSALYERCRGPMFRAAMKVLRQRDDAEDAVQQAFLAVLRHRELLRSDDPRLVTATLVLLAEQKAVDLLRTSHRDRQVPLEEDRLPGVAIPPPETSPLADALARLPVQYRTVLLLRYVAGYEIQELAQLLDSRPSAIKKRLQRAKQALEQALREEGSEE